MTERRPPEDGRERDEAERREDEHARGTLDPGLKEQFERDRVIVRDHPSRTPDSDALQRPHYEPDGDQIA